MSLTIEVVYALPNEQYVVEVSVEHGATVKDALLRATHAAGFPAVDIERCAVGIWGKHVRWSTPLKDRDRVEIYRPLVADPKETRRRRARHRANQVKPQG